PRTPSAAQNRAPIDQRPDDRQGLWEDAALDRLHLEGRGAQVCLGFAVAVTAVGHETPWLLEAILPAGSIGVFGADVLDVEQAAAGFEDAGELGDRGDRVGNRAEDE